MFIINPPSSYIPKYQIGPFRSIDLKINNELPVDIGIDHYFDTRFGKGKYSYHYSGRKAFNSALSHYKLNNEDEVAIFTTTNNFYISGCVTKEIEKFCKWKREITNKTKIIFVNHEFGFPYENIFELSKYGLPIIEDCAHSFFSVDKNESIGKIGDFVIYSFPKIFPLQIGGLLVSNIDSTVANDNHIGKDNLIDIKKVPSYHIKNKDKIIQTRKEVYLALEDKIKTLGEETRFELKSGCVPGVFMFTVKNQNIDLQELKSFTQRHGIESSVFYGERAFFIPVHQHLNNLDLDYFIYILKYFYNKAND